MRRSCRKHVRADQATVRHVATLHALQAFFVGSVMAMLGIYILCVDGIQHSAQVLFLSRYVCCTFYN